MGRWPAKRRTRTLAWTVAGVLALGGLVGVGTLDGESGGRGDGHREAGGAAMVEVPDAGETAPTAGEAGSASRSAGVRSATGGGGDAVAGLSSGGAGGGGGSDDAAGAGPRRSSESAEPGRSRSDPAALGGESLAALDGSEVVRTATVELELEGGTLDRVHRRVRERVAEVGGFVATSTVSGGSGELTVRVPSERFDTVLDDLRELGEVTSETVSGEDVSQELVDLEARLRHWLAQEAAFLELMGEATSIEQTIEIRRELSTIQETIEQIEGRRRFLEDRVELSTITVVLTEPDGAPVPRTEPEQGTLAEAWDRAWDAALTIVGGTVVLLGVVLPLAVIVGVPVLVARSIVRRRG